MAQKPFSKADIIAKLEKILSKSIDAGIPGLSAEIRSSKGILWQSCAGVVDVEAKEPVEKKHLFGIGSITKVFVTVAILQLVDEGKLKIQDTLEAILAPDIYYGIENAPRATIAGLLSHTAGIDSWEDDPVWIINGRGRKLEPKRIWGKAETLDYIRRPNANGPEPGKFSYSNTNFTLLGLIIEKFTQSTAENEIRRRILEPLKMDRTFLEGFEEARPHTSSHRYHWDTETFRDKAGICPSFRQIRENLIDATGSNLSVEWVAGGMVSCPSDLVTFAIALRDGKLLSVSSSGIMKNWRPVGNSEDVGHGLFRFEGPDDAGKWLGHTGSVLGFTGAWWWKESGDCAVSISANIGTMHTGAVPSSISHIVEKTTFLKLAGDLAACREDAASSTATI